MATAEPPPAGTPPRRRWLRLGGPIAVLVVGAAAMGAVVLIDRPPAPPPEPDPVRVEASSVYEFATVDEMVSASDVVVRARVVATERGDLLGADGSDPGSAGIVVREVTLEVDEVWWRSPTSDAATPVRAGDLLVVAEEGWLASGEPLIVDGLAPSAVGDDGVWFLQAIPAGAASETSGPRYLVINSQGRYLVDGSGLSGAEPGDQAERGDQLVAELERRSVDELRDAVRR